MEVFTLLAHLRSINMIEKPKLKAQVIPVFRVYYRDLEQYIQRVFGFEFDFLFATGFVNGMCPEYQVTGTIPSAMAQQAKDLRSGRRTRNLLLIINVLAADGYIPAGKYIIDTHRRPNPTEAYRSLLLRTRDPLAPECLRLKDEHKDNLQLMDRVKVLDQAAAEQLKRARH